MQGVFAPVPGETEHVATAVIGAAIEVHRLRGLRRPPTARAPARPGPLPVVLRIVVDLQARHLAFRG
jgi:hypothetical protein